MQGRPRTQLLNQDADPSRMFDLVVRAFLKSNYGLHDIQRMLRESALRCGLELAGSGVKAAEVLKVHRNTVDRITHRRKG